MKDHRHLAAQFSRRPSAQPTVSRLRQRFAPLMAALCLATSVQAQHLPPPLLDLTTPLGTRANPVRANSPTGQRDYLMRLRCPEGGTPSFSRIGSFGEGPYKTIINIYTVTCHSGQTFEIVIDMYHRHREMAAVPGFTLLSEHPGRFATGCPPVVTGTALGAYVFSGFEVERSIQLPGFNPDVTGLPEKGGVLVRIVIRTGGTVAPEDIVFVQASPDTIKTQAAAYISQLKFTPAEHHAGCAVPQWVEFYLSFK